MADIFISHSTKTFQPGEKPSRTTARSIRNLVFDRLEAVGHRPKLDQRSLSPGDDWNAMLYRWLGQCHGAVMILDPDGLESKWLQREAAILGWRRSQNANLRLITVRVGSASAEAIKAAGLDDLLVYQMITATSDAEATADAVVAALLGGLPIEQDDTPLSRWIEDVAAQLAHAGSAHLARAAQVLGVARDHSQLGDEAETMAYALLHAAPRTARRALQELDSMPSDAFTKLVRLVKPVCIDASTGASLYAKLTSTPRPPIVINTDHPGLGRAYLERAYCRSMRRDEFLAVPDVAGEGGVDESLHALRMRLLEAAGQSAHMGAHLRAMQERGLLEEAMRRTFCDPELFLLLLGGLASSGLPERLRETYPDPAYILLPGLDATAAATTRDAIVIQPELDVMTFVEAMDELERFNALEEAQA